MYVHFLFENLSSPGNRQRRYQGSMAEKSGQLTAHATP